MRVLTLILVFLGTLSSCSHKHHHGHPEGQSIQHDFKDAEMWSKRFDRKDREQWQKPEEVISLMKIKNGQQVAEIGSGTGYMLPFLSKAVGSKGKVFALDVESTLIDFMKTRVSKDKLSNVKVELIPTDSPNLKDKDISRVLFINTWHHISSRVTYSKKLFEQTPKDCQIFLVEPEPGTGGPGPKDTHRMSAPDLIAELTPAGFKCTVLKETLPYQYIVNCQK